MAEWRVWRQEGRRRVRKRGIKSQNTKHVTERTFTLGEKRAGTARSILDQTRQANRQGIKA